MPVTLLNTNCMFIFLCLTNHLSNRILGQRALVAGEGEEVSRAHRNPQRTLLAPPQTSRFSFHCFVNLFSFLAKLTIYKRRLVEVSHKESTANFYDIFSGIKKLFFGKKAYWVRAYVEPFFLPFLQNKGNLQSLSEHKESTENKSVKYLHIFIDFFLITT